MISSTNYISIEDRVARLSKAQLPLGLGMLHHLGVVRHAGGHEAFCNSLEAKNRAENKPKDPGKWDWNLYPYYRG